MGPAHSTIVNQTNNSICVITFNMADLIYKTYHTMYIIEPGESSVVEANPDAVGLKVGIIYETKKDRQELMFHRFSCNNDSILTITFLDGMDISYQGENTNLSNSKGKLRELEVEPYNMAAATLQNEEAEFKPSKISEVMKKVIDTSDAIIKNVTGIEVSNRENNNEDDELTNIAVVPVDSKQKTNKEPMTIKNETPFKSPLKNNHSDASLNNNNEYKFNNNNNIEEDPKMTAEKWEAELERVKREKKWEVELNRIKQEKKAAAENPKPQINDSNENNNNKIIPQFKNNSKSASYQPEDEEQGNHEEPVDSNNNNNNINTAPIVSSASCSVCIIA